MPAALKIKVEGAEYNIRQIGARIGLKPNSALARYRRLLRVTGRKELTWDDLKRGSRGYTYSRPLPKHLVCRNKLRELMRDKGFTSSSLAGAIGSTRQHVDRVLGSAARDRRRNALTPEFVTRVCKALGLDEHETALMHELGAQESGWLF